MFRVGEDLSPTIDWATSESAVAAACEIKSDPGLFLPASHSTVLVRR